MVKVTNKPPMWQHKHTCTCGAELVAFREDLKIGGFGANWGGDTPERLPYFECPCCFKNITLNWGQVPRNLEATIGKSDNEILALVSNAGEQSIEPTVLMNTLLKSYDKAQLIELLQCAIEQERTR